MRNLARAILVLGLIIPLSASAAQKEEKGAVKKKVNKKKAKNPKSKIAFTDPKKAGPDFLVQGEYTGTITTKNEEKKVGIQVIALGDGKFQLVAYEGGLPGDGWDGGEKVTAEGQTEDGVTTFFHGKGSAEISDGKVTISSSGGKSIGTIDRVLRVSPRWYARS